MTEISPEKNMSTPPSLIEIQNLSVCIRNNKQALYPLQGVSFSIGRNLQMALVGESGSGKSLTAAAITVVPGAVTAATVPQAPVVPQPAEVPEYRTYPSWLPAAGGAAALGALLIAGAVAMSLHGRRRRSR